MVIGHFVIPTLIIIWLNCGIFYIAKKAFKARKTFSVKGKDGKEKNYKLAKMIMIYVANIVICWLVYAVNYGIEVFAPDLLSSAVVFGTNLINRSVIATGPLLYGLLNASIRKVIQQKCKSFLQLCSCCKTQKNDKYEEISGETMGTVNESVEETTH
jgi:hypothetical protein